MKTLRLAGLLILGLSTQLNGMKNSYGSFEEWGIWGRHTLESIKAALKDPNKIAQFAASSPPLQIELTRKLREDIEENPEKTYNVLEIGCGSGIVTIKIKKTLRPKDSLTAIEPDEKLATYAEAEFQKATSSPISIIRNFFNKQFMSKKQYSHIICTLPFTKIKANDVKEILETSFELLEVGGTFTFESLLGARLLGHILGKTGFKNREEYEDFCLSMKTLDEWEYNGATFTVTRKMVLGNFTPIWVHHVTRIS